MGGGTLGSRAFRTGMCNVPWRKWHCLGYNLSLSDTSILHSSSIYTSFPKGFGYIRCHHSIWNNFMACTHAKCPLSSGMVGVFYVKTVFGCLWLMCPVPGPVTCS